MAGFEPAHAGTKNRCLTAWLHPKAVETLYSEVISEAQAFSAAIFQAGTEVFPRPEGHCLERGKCTAIFASLRLSSLAGHSSIQVYPADVVWCFKKIERLSANPLRDQKSFAK